MSEYASQLLRRIEAIDSAAADNRRTGDAYQQMAGRLKTVTGRAMSSDRAVTVVAGPGGEIREISFAEQTRGIEPSELGGVVTRTIAAAQADAARRQAEVVRDGLGDSELLDKVLDSDRRLFGDQPPAAAAPVPREETAQPVYEDDFFREFNVFDDEPGR
ncbi:YbaB/EbfC family DNA-binding protein [Amycolatopsis acidicola]|uniref:YbaB/EbfC family DNA-binding protein n=1 Tax=Amycolatopsis acidicola TaxID=2596893 RepID=A0A5N0UPM7_9PSEU|nr:YbaB/EbfC family nucleoid-associated protein [Amycolatopsis acidicola]KAA9152227.1 YbaB/EbfC family DNA-binding protein [Amycolatopsis acidicola]